jgi:hypothetical protein
LFAPTYFLIVSATYVETFWLQKAFHLAPTAVINEGWSKFDCEVSVELDDDESAKLRVFVSVTRSVDVEYFVMVDVTNESSEMVSVVGIGIRTVIVCSRADVALPPKGCRWIADEVIRLVVVAVVSKASVVVSVTVPTVMTAGCKTDDQHRKRRRRQITLTYP